MFLLLHFTSIQFQLHRQHECHGMSIERRKRVRSLSQALLANSKFNVCRQALEPNDLRRNLLHSTHLFEELSRSLKLHASSQCEKRKG